MVPCSIAARWHSMNAAATAGGKRLASTGARKVVGAADDNTVAALAPAAGTTSVIACGCTSVMRSSTRCAQTRPAGPQVRQACRSATRTACEGSSPCALNRW